ncbi:hypothetical protein [Mobilicoccus pelagius]|uniref:Uncharacterized protein n=1 Tax=Mobilicoccus pelagius NBRC 104925 TaxID=1089455 RepID=H5UVA2_9MICO|nr:hypothetical protein [Mobilicoccus pelagius]GAB49660.1 hypothetical protein MOPEL_132_00270 [Mobilicoccus pelagius NBRC 104925]
MSTDITADGGIIDQRAMTTEERETLSTTLRELWWDCHRDFARPVVDLGALRLSETTMLALAADLDEAGYVTHARLVRCMATTQGHASDRPDAPPPRH